MALAEVHRLGLCLTNFDPKNVVVDTKRGTVQIIDFDKAVKHACGVGEQHFALYQSEPSRKDLCCEELSTEAFELDIFTSCTFAYMTSAALSYHLWSQTGFPIADEWWTCEK